MADDRVLMKAKTTFNNPLITVKNKPVPDGMPEVRRADMNTVDVDDEFSTHEAHAAELEQKGMADRISGDADPMSERAAALIGSQTPATDGAIASNRKATETSLGGKTTAKTQV